MFIYKEAIKNMITNVREDTDDFEAIWSRISNAKANVRHVCFKHPLTADLVLPRFAHALIL